MNSLFEKSKSSQCKLNKIISNLDEKTELFDKDRLYELRNIGLEINNQIQKSVEKSSILNLGIIGSVKAGKSSFLNACIFDGKSILPKAATSMTAVLTKISYSDTPSATIHFFSHEDWNDINSDAAEYRSNLEKAYAQYLENFNVAQDKENKNSILSDKKNKMNPKPLDLSEFESRAFRKGISERLKSANEMVNSIRDKLVLEMLGKDIELSEKQMEKINDYVGANGKYTAIVSHAEMRIKNDAVKGLCIIDTPGLNDPIVSRSYKTKEFLKLCDAVILLSPCGQFMDENTIRLLTTSLPDASINTIIVVGSKLDSGILNESSDDFSVAYKTSINSYKETFENNLSNVKKSQPNNPILSVLNSDKVFFISSMFYSIAQKASVGQRLDDEEEHVLSKLMEMKNFQDDTTFYRGFSGISRIRKEINEIQKNKNELLEKRTISVMESVNLKAAKIIDSIYDDVISSRSKLEKNSAEELQRRYSKIQNRLDASRKDISRSFELASLESQKRTNSIKSEVVGSMNNYTNFKTETKTSEHTGTYNAGLFGLRKEVVTKTVTDYTANTSDVKINLQSYVSKCNSIIDKEFNYIVNADKLSNRIKEIVINAFSDNNSDYDENDILGPLEVVLKRIQIPTLSFSTNEYNDVVNSNFPNGYAMNEEIHSLSSLQATLLNRISENVIKRLDDVVNEITTILDRQSVSFSDDISKKINNDLQRLGSQISQRQLFIHKYDEFKDELKDYKHILLEIEEQ